MDGSLLRQLALFLKPCYFSTGENIVSKGDIGHGLYFIYSGSVSHYFTCTCNAMVSIMYMYVVYMYVFYMYNDV